MSKKKLVLKIVFDTNAIYTGSASDLFKKDIVNIIESHSKVNDLEIHWYLPDIVVKERIFQMIKRGREILPAIQKLEKLFGHGLNINEDLIDLRVNETVKKQIEKLGLKVINLDLNKIQWENIIVNSLSRLPPFEDGEKEKGFRDSLILECVKQLIEDSPSTKSICRIAFLTNDSLLTKAVNDATKEKGNFYIYNNQDELNSLINILTSEIKEELINSVSKEANSLFFIKDDQSTLFYSEGLLKQIKDKFPEELNYLPEGAEIRLNGLWRIGKPGFEKKEKQKIFWKTSVEQEFQTYKTLYEETGSTLELPDFIKRLTVSATVNPIEQPKREIIHQGRTRFEILWAVTLTTNKKLISPRIEEIRFVETILK